MLQTYPDVHITNLDKLTYAGNLENLSMVECYDSYCSRYELIKGDIGDRKLIDNLLGKDLMQLLTLPPSHMLIVALKMPEFLSRLMYPGLKFCWMG